MGIRRSLWRAHRTRRHKPNLDTGRSIDNPQCPVGAPPAPWRSPRCAARSAFPGPRDPVGAAAGGVGPRGARGARGAADEHEGPRDRHRRGDDPGAPGAMNKPRLTSAELAAFYLRRIKRSTRAQRRDHGRPTRPPQARAADRAAGGVDSTAAARHPGHRQGQREHDRHADDRRLVGARRQHPVATPSSSSGCAPPARSSSPRPTCPSGRTSARSRRPAAGAASAARRTWPTCSIATRAARAPGTGVAVSADLATVGVGTETDGSIVCPSGANGIVGIKPTLGLLSRAGRHPDLGRPGHRRPDDPQRDRRRGRARRDDRHRPGRSGDRRPGRARVHGLHASSSTPTRSTAPGSASGGGHVRPGDRAGDRRALRTTRSSSSRRWGDRHRSRQRGPHRGGLRSRVRGAAVRVQGRHRVATSRRTRMPATRRRSRTSSTSTTPTPSSRGPGTPRSSSWPRRPAAAQIRRASRRGRHADPIAQASIDDTMATNDLDAIVAPTNGPAWVTDPVNGDTSTASSSRPARPRSRATPDHGAGRLRRPAARRHLVHRRPLGRARADRLRLRVRAGDPGPRPAAVHPDDRPEPAAAARGPAASERRAAIPGRGGRWAMPPIR